jgi:hypothetical protein
MLIRNAAQTRLTPAPRSFRPSAPPTHSLFDSVVLPGAAMQFERNNEMCSLARCGPPRC